jgi:hypothetical protein
MKCAGAAVVAYLLAARAVRPAPAALTLEPA